MATTRRILTVHAETRVDVQLALLDAVEGVLLGNGASRIWIDPAGSPDLMVVAEFDDA